MTCPGMHTLGHTNLTACPSPYPRSSLQESKAETSKPCTTLLAAEIPECQSTGTPTQCKSHAKGPFVCGFGFTDRVRVLV